MSNPYYSAGRSYDSPSALHETPLTAAASALLSSAAATAGGSASSLPGGGRSAAVILSPSASTLGQSASSSAPPSASVGIYERVEVLERSLSADSEWTKSLTMRLAEELGNRVTYRLLTARPSVLVTCFYIPFFSRHSAANATH